MEKHKNMKSSPFLESTQRINMSYLLLTNPKVIETIKQTGAGFFHGTNANALPGILKYGLNSYKKSTEDKININTGEEWSRSDKKRDFVSITDQIEVALHYAQMNINTKPKQNSLLNFGVIVGVSLQDMSDIETTDVNSDVPEVAISRNVPLEHIKFLIVPKDKEEFVKKLVGNKNIEIVTMDLRDKFYHLPLYKKLEILEQYKANNNYLEDKNITFTQDEVKNVVNGRRLSKIHDVFNSLKNRVNNKTRDKFERSNEE